jgi:uncharacterized membrane protein YoaK (UPF0700 family)
VKAVSSNRVRVEESFRVALILTVCGGYLDAFTWLAHDRVLANAQTANVVLFGVYAAGGEWGEAFNYLPPIFAFILGVIVAHGLRDSVGSKTRQISLAAEICILVIVMVLHYRLPNVAGTLGISFAAALQTTSFARVENWAFSSVMTTGNLGRFADALYARLSGRAEPAHDRQAWIFGIISVAFGAGAAVGAVVTAPFGSGALTIPILLLAWALFLCRRSAVSEA